MAPIAMAGILPNASSKEIIEPTPLKAISHGPMLPGIPSFNNLEEKRQWMYEVLHVL